MSSYTSSAGPFTAYDAPVSYDTATYERWGLFVPVQEPAYNASYNQYNQYDQYCQGYPTIGSTADWKAFDDDMNKNKKRVPLLIKHCKTGSLTAESANHIAAKADAKEAELQKWRSSSAQSRGPGSHAIPIVRPPVTTTVVAKVTAPTTKSTTSTTPSLSHTAESFAPSTVTRQSGASTTMELCIQARRRKAAEAAIMRAEDERREREAAQAEKEAREDEAACLLLGITIAERDQAEMDEQDEREDAELFRMLWAEGSGH